GASVVVAARTREQIEAVAASLRDAGRTAYAIPCDVTDPDAVERLAREAVERLGHVDILVNNAGGAGSALLHRLTLEEWNRLFTLNATSAFLCTRAFAPVMVERGWGRIVNIASVAGLMGARYIAAYAAAKHAVVGFTRAAAAELAASGVTVNAVQTHASSDRSSRRARRRLVAHGLSRFRVPAAASRASTASARISPSVRTVRAPSSAVAPAGSPKYARAPPASSNVCSPSRIAAVSERGTAGSAARMSSRTSSGRSASTMLVSYCPA